MILYKVFKKGRKSNNGNTKWRKNKWNHHEGELKLCKSGFHASERIIDAMQYTNCEEIALVEIGDDFIKGNDKYVCRDMRILKTYKWTKKDSVALAIYAAGSAAGSAAWSARSAAWAARSATLDKCEQFILKRIKGE